MLQNNKFTPQVAVLHRRRHPNELSPTFGLNKRAKINMKNEQNPTDCPYFPPAPKPNQGPRFTRAVAPAGPSNIGKIEQPPLSIESGQMCLDPSLFDSPFFQNGPPVASKAEPLHPRVFSMGPPPIFPSPAPFRANFSTNATAPRFTSHVKQDKKNQIQMFTGTVGKVLLWAKMARNQRVLFEVMGYLDHVRNGRKNHEKIFMMRDAETGPVLQVYFYEIDRPLIEFEPGCLVKVQGAMTGRSRLQAYNVHKSSAEELAAAQHIMFICDRAAHDLIVV